MKKIVLSLALSLLAGSTFAQEATPEVKDGWTKGGNLGLTFNQSAFNNEWTAGGIGNTTVNLLINYDMNLVKGDLVWDNKLILDYGVIKNKGAEKFTKSNDRLELNSIAGKKAGNNWFYSANVNVKTQIDRGDSNGIITHFFSPAYILAGPGMLWKKSENLNVNISPIESKAVFVHKHFTEMTGQANIDAFNAAGGYFGVEANKSLRYELGMFIRGYYKTEIMKNVTVENILALYANYLEDPQNVDIDYTMNLAMKVNKYVSANLVFQAIYDDNAQRNGFQIREAFGVGFNAKF